MLSKIIDNGDMRRITKEFSRLKGRCYLETSGAALYPQCLLQRINEDMTENVYMNPHTDKYTKDAIDQIRYLVLQFLNTDPSEYTVIFTSGTTQGLKLIVESFQFSGEQNKTTDSGSFVYLEDNHTSVLGLREIASDKNADVIHITHSDFLECVNSEQNKIRNHKKKHPNGSNNLFVFSAQSNFNGYKYPLESIDNIKDGCLNVYKTNSNWYILLDAASYVGSNKLDLTKIKPDFVCFSFYKIFGYPTGLGAVIVRNSSANVLSQKRYFGGGTVDIVLSNEDFVVRRHNLSESFEDGTQSFLAILALKHCFDVFTQLIPSIIEDNVMETISYHTFYLAQELYRLLKKLKHSNGTNAAVLYHDSDFTDIKRQSGTVTFNLVREDKSFIGYVEMQHTADLFNINIRTGCLCNSGSCQRHLKMTNKEIKNMYRAGHKCGDDLDLINGKPTGVIRVSFGYYNTYQDVDKLMTMICRCFVRTKYKPPKRKTGTFMDAIENKQNGYSKSDNYDTLYKEPGMLPMQDDKGLKITKTSVFEHEITLSEIAIFPIKSCGAFKIKSDWKIAPRGLQYDREWMIVRENGVCLTQKQVPTMCLIRPVINLKKRMLILNFRGKSSIAVPIDINSNHTESETVLCQSKVCADTVRGIDCGNEVADWISEALGISYLRLIKQSENDKRKLKNKKNETISPMLSLSNQAQYLLVNKATVRWLRDQITDPDFQDSAEELTDRFRANFVVEMERELSETEWQSLLIGKFEFKVDGNCNRCGMVCIDQNTGDKTIEPLRTISELFSGKIRFGIYLSYVGHVNGSNDCTIKIGSKIEPIADNEDIRFKFCIRQ